MAASNPPKRAQAFLVDIVLNDMAVAGAFKANPTLAAGDFKVSKDGGALTNLTTLPAVSPAGSVVVTLSMSATEMTADRVTIVGIDQTAPKEWTDFVLSIPTTA